MQRQGGGGNDPKCGCDMQAGWPVDLARGGTQMGGNCGCGSKITLPKIFGGGAKKHKKGCPCLICMFGVQKKKKTRRGKAKGKRRQTRRR